MKKGLNYLIYIRLFIILFIIFLSLFLIYHLYIPKDSDSSSEFISDISIDYSELFRLTALDLMNISENKQGFSVAGTQSDVLRGDYIYSKFTEIGLSNVRRESVVLDSWNIGNISLSFDCSCKESGTMTITQLGVYPTPFNYTNSIYELVYVNEGSSLDFSTIDVNGKGVLINNKEGKDMSEAVKLASDYGASFVIYPTISKYSQGSVKVDIDMLKSPSIPVFTICLSNYILLRDSLSNSSSGPFSVILNGYSEINKDVESDFIIGEIEGNNPNKYVYVTANRDSIFYGFMSAHVSCAELLELAKELVLDGYKPDYTIRFMVTTGSEWGVLGEGKNAGILRYLESLNDSELKNIESVLVLDGSKPLNEVVLTETQVNNVNSSLKEKLLSYNESFKDHNYRFINTVNDISSVYNTEGIIWDSYSIPTIIQAEPTTSDYYYIDGSSSDSAKLQIDQKHSAYLMDYYRGIIEIISKKS